jgi:cellulose synthase/poly-beta-1,6-N-acetylglucosamine synthase-like glycosyltransferase
MNPVVSVILPVRNGGAYLAEAVASILDQSLHRLELILVNDHSDDDSIAAISRQDKRLCVIDSSGRGVARAFNAGLSQARGQFVARMDADDVSMPNRLEVQSGFLEKHPGIDICGACVEIFSQQELAGGNLRYQQWLNNCRTPEQIHRELFIESPIPNPSAMFRRDAIEKLGGYGDPDWPEDYDLFLRADAAGMSMTKPEQTLLKWREHPQRLTRTDSRYDIARFQAAKAHYLATYRLQGKPVIIWGAGPTGRLMHDLLQAAGVSILGFLEVHPRRIGGSKRGLPMWPIEKATELENEFVLVAVGAAGARDEIRVWMDAHEKQEGRDYLFVA